MGNKEHSLQTSTFWFKGIEEPFRDLTTKALESIKRYKESK